MPLFQLGGENRLVYLGILPAFDTSAVSRNQVHSFRFNTDSVVFSEPLARVLKQIALLYACLSGPCTSCFALFSDICLPNHYFYSLYVKGSTD